MIPPILLLSTTITACGSDDSGDGQTPDRPSKGLSDGGAAN